MTKYFIEQKDGHQYKFNNIRDSRSEIQSNGVEIFIISGQFKERQRFKDVRILPQTIKDTNYPKLRGMMLMYVS
jgi:hypothetical protein